MHQGVKKKDKPLLVKEVILPHGQDGSGSSRNSWNKSDKQIMKGSQEVTCHRKGDQHEPEVLSLMVVQEKSLKNYFEGTREGKKVRKRKTKHHRTVIPPAELFSDEAHTLLEGDRKQTEEGLKKEEKTEVQLLSSKIYQYEKTREEAHKKNYVRQKRAEEDYICQLEALAKKWFKTGERRQLTKKFDDDFTHSKSPKKSSEGTSNKKTSRKISSTSRELCSKVPVLPPGKPKKVFNKMCQPVQTQLSDSVLEDDFYKKLVFVDEDSDEFDYTDQNLQFRNSSR